MHQFDGGCGRTAREIPDIGIDNVGSGRYRRHYRSKTVAGRTVGMEIYRHIYSALLHLADERGHPCRRNQSAHILDGYHVGAERHHLTGLIDEIFIGEDRFRVLFAFEPVYQTERRILRVHRIADGTVGYAAVFLHILYRGFDIVHIVQRIEYTHDIEARFDGIPAETLYDFVRIGGIAEEIAAARKRRQFRGVAHDRLNLFEPVPWVLAQIAHHGIGHGTAPHLHRIEVSILVERQDTVNLRLCHPGCKSRLLAVAQRQVPDF